MKTAVAKRLFLLRPLSKINHKLPIVIFISTIGSLHFNTQLMNIKSIFFILSIILFSLFSCDSNGTCCQNKGLAIQGKSQQNSPSNIENINNKLITFDSTAYHLLQNKCMVCHTSVGKTHDEMIAPPIIAVKRRYSNVYDNREDFTKAIVDWAKDPQEENAIMYGAVDKFKTMPYLNFEEEDLQKIANFIYDNEVETPEWFEDHFKEMHPDGKMGKKGKGMGKNRGHQ